MLMPNIIPVNDLNIEELDIFTKYNEVQLLHYYEPKEGIFIAESPNVIARALAAGYEPLSILMDESEGLGSLEQVLTQWSNLPIHTASNSVLKEMRGFSLTRGLMCAMRRKPLLDASALVGNLRRIAVLEDVVNPTNIGAIFRSAAALNIDAVLLTPACCDPLYRRSARVSMGTVFQIPWTFFPDNNYIATLHELGFKTVAMALKEDSYSIDDPELKAEPNLAILLGTEGEGLKNETIEACDYTVMIPMTHGVDSLNVAAASAVAFWELGK